MVEIGTSGWPWRASGIAVGSAIGAETDGAHAVWFTDTLPIPEPAAGWAAVLGPLAPAIRDPTDLADPVVTATAALLVTRAITVGILGWEPGPDPRRAVRTLASLADLAPARTVVALDSASASLREIATECPPDAAIGLATYGGGPAVAAEIGWGWIAAAASPVEVAKAAGDVGVTGSIGVHLPVLVHADDARAQKAATAPVMRPLLDGLAPDAYVVGDPSRLADAIDEYVKHGVERIVIENLMPFAAPDELEASRAALRSVIRGARLRHRAP